MLNTADGLASAVNVQSILYLMGEKKVFCTIIKIYYVNSDILVVCLIHKILHLTSTTSTNTSLVRCFVKPAQRR